MQFKLELAVKVIDGTKTQTRRWTPNKPVSCGNRFFAELNRYDPHSRFAQLQATTLSTWTGKHITRTDAIAEGFTSPQAFHKAYKEINAHKSEHTKSGKRRSHWAIGFKVVNLLYNPTLPDEIKDAMRKQWLWCGCGDAFFPLNADTSEKQCNTCTMLDKAQIDRELEQLESLHTAKGDIDEIVKIEMRVIERIRQNYAVQIQPCQRITQAFVDGLFG